MNNDDAYNNITQTNNDEKSKNQKWTLYLLTCCMVASLASFTFGYNIGVTNLPTPLIKDFYSQRYFQMYHEGQKKLEAGKAKLNQSEIELDGKFEGLKTAFNTNSKQNKTIDEIKELALTQARSVNESDKDYNKSFPVVGRKLSELNENKKLLSVKEAQLKEGGKKVENINSLLWTLTTSVFVIGGTIGALTSKNVAERFGRKNGIIFHYSFAILGAILSIVSYYTNSPECVIISRLLFGVQGGMACGLIPTYLYEISPSSLRGATGVIHQLFLTVGICVSQLLGFRQILGTPGLWHFLLGIPIITCVLGAVLLFIVYPETPSSLIRKYKDEDGAENALKKLRNSSNVEDELDEIRFEINKDSKVTQGVSILELFRREEYKWPLIIGLVLQLTQQLCGINAVFFYSESIFRGSGITDEYIQYAVASTGIINVISTIIAVPLIDRAGRKPLLVFPMCVIVIDFIAFTFFLVFKHVSYVMSYLSIVCIVIFIICFAVGLGPIPFIYVAESFPNEARSAALAICMFTNWVANLILAMSFTYVAKLLEDYTFLVFTVIVLFAVIFIFKKVPETKNKTPEQILAAMDSKYANQNQEASGKLMEKTNV